MRRVALITAVAAIAPLSLIGVALTATSWWDGVTSAIGYLLAFGILREWSLDGYPRRASLAVMVTAASWIIGVLTAGSPISFVPLALVSALLIVRLRRWRLWIVALALGIGAVGATAFTLHPATIDLALAYVVTPIVGTLFIAGVILLSEQAWIVVRRLEHANETEAELAVARERVRFAGDLHDIQGHSLHVIKLKSVLAGRLVRSDPDRAEQELAEIRGLADETITETRTLAYARYELNLAAELENARRLFEAAGISVDAHYDADGLGSPHPLLAQVLREATTNLLRHARPTTVTISASSVAVEVANDGVTDGGDTPLRGLARLRERVENAGGVMRIERSPDQFVVSARIDARPDDGVKERAAS